ADASMKPGFDVQIPASAFFNFLPSLRSIWFPSPDRSLGPQASDATEAGLARKKGALSLSSAACLPQMQHRSLVKGSP
ncbi:hypothetical protein, partial [Rhodoblastus sp.]|uniref:hypothetical protein n=1 Tax=Rhodoblastus sp. TaxID=1962975 RepID=UPI003F99D28C